MFGMKKRVTSLKKKIDELALALEKLKLAEYMKHLNNTKRLIWKSFLGGIARGLGIAVGFTLLGAVVLYILQQSFINNLPLIGDFIADIVKIANEKLGLR